MFKSCQPIKLSPIMKILPLCPFVIRIESFRALVAVTLGLHASIYGVIEYASDLIIVGINNEKNPTNTHRNNHRDSQHIPPSLRTKFIFRVVYGSE